MANRQSKIAHVGSAVLHGIGQNAELLDFHFEDIARLHKNGWLTCCSHSTRRAGDDHITSLQIYRDTYHFNQLSNAEDQLVCARILHYTPIQAALDAQSAVLLAARHHHEPSLYRALRLLASQGIFAELSPGSFSNTDASNTLRTEVPGSLRSMVRFRGTDFFCRPFGEILYSLQTGQPTRSKVLGMDGWEYLRLNPEAAAIFDDAMTDFASMAAPSIAAAYDFSQWDSNMDVGGGNGVLLAAILKAHPAPQGRSRPSATRPGARLASEGF